jgi:hypothetical protein
MSDITREEFAAAVAAAVSSVHHLYREVDRLIVGLRDALAAEPCPLTPVRGTLGKSGRDQGRFVIRYEYGTLFSAQPSDEEALGEDEDEEDVEEADEEEGGPRVHKYKPREIVAGQPLLAVRIVMHDPVKQAALEPQVQYAVMSEWGLGSSAAQAGTRFVVARYMLRRIPRALGGGGAGQGKRLVTRAAVKRAAGTKGGSKSTRGRLLSATLPRGIATEPLFSGSPAVSVG